MNKPSKDRVYFNLQEIAELKGNYPYHQKIWIEYKGKAYVIEVRELSQEREQQ